MGAEAHRPDDATRTVELVPRPPRLQVAGGVFHVTARGNRRQPIFTSDRERSYFLALLGVISARLGWRCHAYCLMTNHVLDSHQAAVDIVRAFGGDPGFLDITPDRNPEPDTA